MSINETITFEETHLFMDSFLAAKFDGIIFFLYTLILLNKKSHER